MKALMFAALVALALFPSQNIQACDGVSLFGGQGCGSQQQFAAVPMYGVQQQFAAVPMYGVQQQVFAAPQMFGYGVVQQQPVIVNQRFGRGFGFNRGFGFRRGFGFNRGFGRGFGLGRGFGNRQQFGLFNFSF